MSKVGNEFKRSLSLSLQNLRVHGCVSAFLQEKEMDELYIQAGLTSCASTVYYTCVAYTLGHPESQLLSVSHTLYCCPIILAYLQCSCFPCGLACQVD